MEDADFGGFATKAGLKCTDGRTITAEAFKHMDKAKVPLVWQHGHSDPSNVLGHAILEARPDGMYAWGFFNKTKQGKNARDLVQHKDIDRLSIWANQLVEQMIAGGKAVLHGVIREVSIVLAGANPGARIDYVRLQHGDNPDDVEVLSDEAIIHSGLNLDHVWTPPADDDDDEEEVKKTKTSEITHIDGSTTVAQIYNGMSDVEKNVVHYVVGKAIELTTQGGTVAQSDTATEGDLAHQEGKDEVTHNVFDQTDAGTEGKGSKVRHHVSEADMKSIVESWKKGGSFKHAVEEYAVAHGITDIDVLFPDARTIADRPEFDKRRTEWVAGVLGGARKSPFSRIKTITADLTQEAARAKGYIKGNYKKEEWFGVTARVTTPTTVYKKQRLDRDDIVDITDFDVVAWLKMEMRLMLEEELARAILIGDGRDPGDDDKIKDPAGAAEGAGIRSIVNDHELFVTSVYVNLGDASSSYTEVIEEVLRARKFYKGTGSPTFYTTDAVATEMLLLKDSGGRRFYNNMAELASALRVNDIVIVEVMEDVATDIVGILVNMADYNIGADRGGEVNLFDDFDLDYNQYKYLIETRISGALTKIKSALVVRTTTSTNVLVHPVTSPTFNTATGVATIPAQTGVVYKNGDTNATLTAGAQSAIAAGATLNVIAVPASGYYFKTNAEDQWSFTRDAA